jgi:hypothetical protein
VERTPDGEYIDAPVAEDLEPVANLVAATDKATSDARWWPKNTRRRVAPTAARWLQSWLSLEALIDELGNAPTHRYRARSHLCH